MGAAKSATLTSPDCYWTLQLWSEPYYNPLCISLTPDFNSYSYGDCDNDYDYDYDYSYDYYYYYYYYYLLLLTTLIMHYYTSSR